MVRKENQPSEKPRITIIVSVPAEDSIDDYEVSADTPEPFTPESLKRATERLAEHMVFLLRVGGVFPLEPREGGNGHNHDM